MTDHSNHDHSHDQSFDGFTIDEIKKNFSSLAQELEEGGQPIGEVLKETEENLPPQSSSSRVFQGYDPSVKDFLARATTAEECKEIIAYCLKKGDINAEEADQLLHRLDRGGPRAFGTRRPGYYDRNE